VSPANVPAAAPKVIQTHRFRCGPGLDSTPDDADDVRVNKVSPRNVAVLGAAGGGLAVGYEWASRTMDNMGLSGLTREQPAAF
jgi:hypothetical protein